jgi:hypothetical protein
LNGFRKEGNIEVGVSLRKLAKILGRAPSGLCRLQQTGAIPRLCDGTYDVGAVRAALDSNINLTKSPIWRRQQGEYDDGPVEAVFYEGLWRTPEEAAAMRRRRRGK